MIKIFDKTKKYSVTDIGEEYVIFPNTQDNNDESFICTMNEVCLFIFENIDGKKEIKEIIELVCKEYDVSYEEASNDTNEIISQLLDKKLIYLK